MKIASSSIVLILDHVNLGLSDARRLAPAISCFSTEIIRHSHVHTTRVKPFAALSAHEGYPVARRSCGLTFISILIGLLNSMLEITRLTRMSNFHGSLGPSVALNSECSRYDTPLSLHFSAVAPTKHEKRMRREQNKNEERTQNATHTDHQMIGKAYELTVIMFMNHGYIIKSHHTRDAQTKCVFATLEHRMCSRLVYSNLLRIYESEFLF